jgi:hypothetical protein
MQRTSTAHGSCQSIYVAGAWSDVLSPGKSHNRRAEQKVRLAAAPTKWVRWLSFNAIINLAAFGDNIVSLS